jgi:mannitol-specific phosphotransferase system IIBC component
MSVLEAISAAIGSFAIGSLAAYLIEQQEEEEEEEQQQLEQELEMKEKQRKEEERNKKNNANEKSKWRIFKEAKAEAAAALPPEAVKMYTRQDGTRHDR